MTKPPEIKRHFAHWSVLAQELLDCDHPWGSWEKSFLQRMVTNAPKFPSEGQTNKLLELEARRVEKI